MVLFFSNTGWSQNIWGEWQEAQWNTSASWGVCIHELFTASTCFHLDTLNIFHISKEAGFHDIHISYNPTASVKRPYVSYMALVIWGVDQDIINIHNKSFM